MGRRRKGDKAYSVVQTRVKSLPRRVYKRKTGYIRLSDVIKKKPKNRQKGKGATAAIASILGEVAKPAITNFWNEGKQRQAQHRKAVEDFYYRS